MTKYWSLHPLLYYDYPKYYVYAPMKSLLTPALNPPSWPLYKEPQGDQVWLNHVALIGVTFNMVLYDEEILIKIILLNQKDHCCFFLRTAKVLWFFIKLLLYYTKYDLKVVKWVLLKGFVFKKRSDFL